MEKLTTNLNHLQSCANHLAEVCDTIEESLNLLSGLK